MLTLRQARTNPPPLNNRFALRRPPHENLASLEVDRVGAEDESTLLFAAAVSRRCFPLGWNDLHIREIAAGTVPYPEPHQPSLAVAQLIDNQARLLRVGDEDADLRARDDDAGMEPCVRIRNRIHGLLVLPRLFGTQLLPLIDRMRDVLDAVAAPVGV